MSHIWLKGHICEKPICKCLLKAMPCSGTSFKSSDCINAFNVMKAFNKCIWYICKVSLFFRFVNNMVAHFPHENLLHNVLETVSAVHLHLYLQYVCLSLPTKFSVVTTGRFSIALLLFCSSRLCLMFFK